MRSFLSICLIVVLSLFLTDCAPKRFIPQGKKFDVIYEGQNLVPNGDIEILDNGQPVGWNYKGKCAVGFPGFQSNYALTMEVPNQDNLGKWEAQALSGTAYRRKEGWS